MSAPNAKRDLQPEELEQIRRWLEGCDTVRLSEEMYDLVARRWPHLLGKVIRESVLN